jgi:isopenicillin N synthase-like dioxygenase
VAGTPEEEWFTSNEWPADLPGLRPAATAWRDACGQLAGDLLRVFALALELPTDFFVVRCAGGTWSAGLTWHRPSDAGNPVRLDPSTDAGVLTLQDRRPGTGCLQVRTADGAWAGVPAVPGALTLGAGDLLARWTADRWRSAPHRVLPPLQGEEGASLFLASGADPLAVVERPPTAAAGPSRHQPVTVGDFLRGRMERLAVG